MEKRVAQKVQATVKPFHVSKQAFALLGSTAALVFASLIFGACCPPEVKDFTQTQWQYANKRSLLHYWPLAWSQPIARAICAFFYIVGGIVFFVVSTWKIIEAGIYAWQYLLI